MMQKFANMFAEWVCVFASCDHQNHTVKRYLPITCIDIWISVTIENRPTALRAFPILLDHLPIEEFAKFLASSTNVWIVFFNGLQSSDRAERLLAA